jgi:hypothetical protein
MLIIVKELLASQVDEVLNAVPGLALCEQVQPSLEKIRSVVHQELRRWKKILGKKVPYLLTWQRSVPQPNQGRLIVH